MDPSSMTRTSKSGYSSEEQAFRQASRLAAPLWVQITTDIRGIVLRVREAGAVEIVGRLLRSASRTGFSLRSYRVRPKAHSAI